MAVTHVSGTVTCVGRATCENSAMSYLVRKISPSSSIMSFKTESRRNTVYGTLYWN